MNRGDVVIVRAMQGEPLVRRVVEMDGEGVLVCREETWQTMGLSHGEEVPASGFPLFHVFRYEPPLFEALSSAYKKGDVTELDRLWQDAETLTVAG